MSENAKSNLKKLIVGIALALAGAGGADAAGYSFDPSSLKELGLGPAAALILYLELRFFPRLVELVAGRTGTPSAPPEAAPEPAAKTSSKANIALVRAPTNGEAEN